MHVYSQYIYIGKQNNNLVTLKVNEIKVEQLETAVSELQYLAEQSP